MGICILDRLRTCPYNLLSRCPSVFFSGHSWVHGKPQFLVDGFLLLATNNKSAEKQSYIYFDKCMVPDVADLNQLFTSVELQRLKSSGIKNIFLLGLFFKWLFISNLNYLVYYFYYNFHVVQCRRFIGFDQWHVARSIRVGRRKIFIAILLVKNAGLSPETHVSKFVI